METEVAPQGGPTAFISWAHVVDQNKLDYARHLRDSGHTIAEIIAKTGIPRSSLYRHLPPRPAQPLTAADPASTR